MHEPLSTDYFKMLHAICSNHIDWLFGQGSGIFREHPPTFGLTIDSLSFAGYLELLNDFVELIRLETTRSLGFDITSAVETDELYSTINDIVQSYEKALNDHSNDPEETLKAIIILCKKLVLIHPLKEP